MKRFFLLVPLLLCLSCRPPASARVAAMAAAVEGVAVHAEVTGDEVTERCIKGEEEAVADPELERARDRLLRLREQCNEALRALEAVRVAVEGADEAAVSYAVSGEPESERRLEAATKLVALRYSQALQAASMVGETK